MALKKIYLHNLVDGTIKIDLQLELIAGENGLDKEITVADVNRPGLSLAGFFDFFAFGRIQVFGLGETAFMRKLPEAQRKEMLEMFFSYDILCCVFTHGESPDDLFIELANSRNIPVFISQYRTTRFVSLWIHAVEGYFAPTITVHGSLVDVFGVGVLLLGKSGVGKSECALELIEKGHRLVADDIVEIQKIDEIFLFGKSAEIITHHMEIRGLGIINVKEIYGIASVRNRKRIDLIIMLEEWERNKEYDRLGIDEHKYSILDINLSFITVPVRPGRNIPILIETAALNHRLKKTGTFSAKDLDFKIQEKIKLETAKKE
ncbi:MAG: HPr kinase/phosphorylase [Spirochaetes bacterium]|nr:HPr kinase/phosphorylase [Spirochaetota bacterium]